jgi:hypothetical protein
MVLVCNDLTAADALLAAWRPHSRAHAASRARRVERLRAQC